MFYFQPRAGLVNIIGVLSSKEKIFTLFFSFLSKEVYAISFPPAFYSLLNLRPVPIQHGQGVDSSYTKKFGFPLETCISTLRFNPP